MAGHHHLFPIVARARGYFDREGASFNMKEILLDRFAKEAAASVDQRFRSGCERFQDAMLSRSLFDEQRARLQPEPGRPPQEG